MKALLAAAGREFLKAAWAVFIVSVFGILAAPDAVTAVALSITALAAAIAAGIKAVQVFLPQLTVVNYLPERLKPYGSWIDSFIRGLIAGASVYITGWLAAPDLSNWKAIVVGLVVGALNAAFRAVEGAGTVGEFPAPDKGIRPAGA